MTQEGKEELAAERSRFELNGRWKMINWKLSTVVTLFMAPMLIAGCHFDPNVRKQKYLESGERYSAEGKYREAAIQYLNAIKIDKGFPDAHYKLAQAYAHMSQFGAALGELRRTEELDPKNYKARIDLGSLLLAGGKTDDAQAEANAILAAQPNDPDAHAMLSAIDLKRGQNDQALTEIRRAIAIDPSRAQFHDDLALIESRGPAPATGVEDELKKSVALDPKSVNARILLAAFYAQNNRWPEAEQAGRAAVATDPKSLAARECLAQIYVKQGDSSKAEQVLRQAASDLADDPQGVRALANYYERTGQLDKAREEYATLAAKYPKNLSLQEAYVRVLIQAKDQTTAQSVVNALLKKNGKEPQVLALQGIVLVNAGQPDQAVDALLNATRNNPKDAFLQFWLGKAALAKGDNGLAESSFRRSAELNPPGIESLQELAAIAERTRNINLLSETADKMISAAPDSAVGYVWRAAAQISRNAPDQAEVSLKRAIEIAPQNALAYVQLGKLRFAQRRFPEGVSLFEKALQCDPNSVEALRMLVSYDFTTKQAGRALTRVEEQIEKSPKNGAFYDLLAQIQIQNQSLDQAATAAQKAIDLNPGDGEAVMLYAQIQAQRGQLPNAIAVWQKWLVAHPNDANGYAILGTLEEAGGTIDKAEVDYKRALQIQPQQPIAANNLAYRMLLGGGNVDVALTLAQTARRSMPNSPTTADTLAWAYYQKGTYAFARDLLDDAIKTEPNNAAMQYHLGMVCNKLKDKNDATLHLRKAVSLAPGSPTAKDAQNALQGLS